MAINNKIIIKIMRYYLCILGRFWYCTYFATNSQIGQYKFVPDNMNSHACSSLAFCKFVHKEAAATALAALFLTMSCNGERGSCAVTEAPLGSSSHKCLMLTTLFSCSHLDFANLYMMKLQQQHFHSHSHTFKFAGQVDPVP